MITTQATTIVRLIYEHGVFRPLEPVELAEGQIVQLSLPQQALALPQHERIKAWLATWPDKLATIPDTWWDEFDAFLKANRFDLPERDLGLGDE